MGDVTIPHIMTEKPRRHIYSLTAGDARSITTESRNDVDNKARSVQECIYSVSRIDDERSTSAGKKDAQDTLRCMRSTGSGRYTYM